MGDEVHFEVGDAQDGGAGGGGGAATREELLDDKDPVERQKEK